MGSAWLIFSMFGGPSLSLILEETAVERPVQLARLVATFGLDLTLTPNPHPNPNP